MEFGTPNAAMARAGVIVVGGRLTWAGAMFAARPDGMGQMQTRRQTGGQYRACALLGLDRQADTGGEDKP